MATFDASLSDVGFNMNDVVSVDFSSNGFTGTGQYWYFTDGGDKVSLHGTGFTYSGGVPTGGTVIHGKIDLDGDDGISPEIVFSGLNNSLVLMRNGAAPSNAIAFFDEMLNFTNDTVRGSPFDDTLKGLGGADSIIGGDGDDSLEGGAGIDFLAGDEGADALSGGDGGDFLRGGHGLDTLDGGAGVDVLDWSNTGTPLNIDLAAGTADQGGTPKTISGVENIFGSTANDTLIGSSGENALSGFEGDDIVNGGGASDYLEGLEGADTLFGGQGFDSILGGAGDDIVRAGSVGDTVYGGADNDNIAGQGGADWLYGEDGDDVMRGNVGIDYLFGGNGDDVISGRAGVDTMHGAGGDDVLTGKGGADFYEFQNFGAQTDTLRTFAAGVGAGDMIRIIGFGTAFDTFAEVMAAATQIGGDTQFDLSGGNFLVVKGVLPGAFAADDFTFI